MQYFFLGIGGIGMSALARYFHAQGEHVSGYDRTPSPLTKELESEGITILYKDDPSLFTSTLSSFTSTNTLVVRTPAVPEDSHLYTYLRETGFRIVKRAEILGEITMHKRALCVAGTHGKTTTSTMIAHLLYPTNAFLGGISMNYHTNLLLNKESEYVVVEADEYDRSFHHLQPYISVVTAVDADHLDIYGTEEAYREAFNHYTSLITGALVMKKGIALEPRLQEGVRCYTYGSENAQNIRIEEGQIIFDYVSERATISDIRLGVPVWVNIENALAAITVALAVGISKEQIRERLATFKGVLRRFNIHINTPQLAYIDDYAHHPQEIATAIDSVRKLYPERRLIGVFQPHLYTRTRDFAQEFKQVLSTLDDCLLLPIYPAREEPIPGVTSEMLIESNSKDHLSKVVEKVDLIPTLRKLTTINPRPTVILTIGAGDIDRLVPQITKELIN